ncbi:MAG: alpha-L-fucosidase [Terriglobia bacterium]|jgi:alpha-L-fucosidase
MHKDYLSGLIFLFALTAGAMSIGISGARGAEGAAPPQGAQASEDARTAWYREAKFGMFIHWGPYSLASVEASWPIMRPEAKWNITEPEYVSLYKKFSPIQYDPAAWVELAKQAGQRYMVITTKHHDGFCMFDSKLTDYKITNTPYGKDVIAMLAKAAHDAGMPLGFYYSPPDMHHPGYRDTTKLVKDSWHGDPRRREWSSYLDYMEGQLRELLTNYGPVALVWFDGLDREQKYNGQRFINLIHELQPAALTNDRIGVEGDFETPEQQIPDRVPTKPKAFNGPPFAQLAAPVTLPPPEDFQLWETCMTINDTWAYNKNDQHFKSVKVLIQDLANVSSKGGNFLLDVGPTPEGTIQPEFVERLQAMGQWMKVNGDSIYGTTYGPWQDLTFGKSTAKGKTIYLHVFDWPSNHELELPALATRVSRVTLLATGHQTRFKQKKDRLLITVPSTAPDPNDSVLRIDTK